MGLISIARYNQWIGLFTNNGGGGYIVILSVFYTVFWGKKKKIWDWKLAVANGQNAQSDTQ